jgi:hypothetical protein
MPPKPVIFLAFANDKVDNARYLRNLPAELSGIRQSLQEAEKQELCEVILLPNATIQGIFDTFQDTRYRDRIAIFHYGGHADSYQLLLETLPTVANQTAYSEGLVSFFAKQKGLQLAFFNGCSTHQQAQELAQAGIPAVIGTDSKIDDEVAMRLAIRFYKGIGQLLALQRAWEEAKDEITTTHGGNPRGLYRKEAKEEVKNELPWNLYCQNENSLSWKLKNQYDMLAEQLFSSLLSMYESGGAEFLKSVGVELAKGLATDTLKKLGTKTLDFFKGKKEAEKEIKLLKHAVNEQNIEDFKQQTESVLTLLKEAIQSDKNFRQEVEEILNGLDEKSKQAVEETTGKIIKNISNIKGSKIIDNSLNINQENKEGDNIIGSDFLDKYFKKKE